MKIYVGTRNTAVFFFHGFRGSPRNFKEYAEQLHRNGFTCILPDYGRGIKGNVYHWDDLLTYLTKIIQVENRPCILIGHSLGGGMALALAGHPLVRRVFALSAFHDETVFSGDLLKYLNRAIRGIEEEDIQQHMKPVMPKHRKYPPDISGRVWLAHGMLDLIVRYSQFEANMHFFNIPAAQTLTLPYASHWIMGFPEVRFWIMQNIPDYD